MSPTDVIPGRLAALRFARRRRRGFSLLEVLVVIIMVGIITRISFGKMSTIRSQQQVVRAASTIQTEMEKTFALAARNHAPMRINYDATNMLFTVTNRLGTVEYGRVSLATSYGLKSSEVTVTRTFTEVYPNGFANDTLSVKITAVRGSQTYSRRVRMSRAGLVKVI